MRTTRTTCSSTSTTTPTTTPLAKHTLNCRCCRAWGCALRSKLLMIGIVAIASACELDKTAIPRTESQLALHGVLSASASTQVVLLERTRNGTVQFVAPSFELEDPIGTDEGIAETGATAALRAPDGSVIVASEDAVTNGGKGQGVYRFSLAGSSLQRNATYRLSVINATR